ncbi:hypothetical protein Hanom_Chr12g01073901 [Helianthus anomalus]
MGLTSRMKMARFQTFWIQMRKNKHLDESRKTGQTLGTKMAFYSISYVNLRSHPTVSPGLWRHSFGLHFNSRNSKVSNFDRLISRN